MSNKILAEAIIEICKGTYRIKRLGDQYVVAGQAMSYLQQRLRDDGWKGVSYANIVKYVEGCPALSFDRGRGRRIYHGGKMGWGSLCDVVWVVYSQREVTDEQLSREEDAEFEALIASCN